MLLMLLTYLLCIRICEIGTLTTQCYKGTQSVAWQIAISVVIHNKEAFDDQGYINEISIVTI